MGIHRSKITAMLIAGVAVLVAMAGLASLHVGPLGSRPSSAATANISVGDNWFCDASFQGSTPCVTTVNAGDTVTWNFTTTQNHTTTCTSCSPSFTWDSGQRNSTSNPASFSKTFTQAGVFTYRCDVHPTEMHGQIVVNSPTVPATPIVSATPPPQALTGDVNCSHTVDSIDAALVLQLSAGLVSSLGCQQNGDVNGDGQINSIDAALILQYVAGLISHLPPGA